MDHLITELTKYLIIILMTLYTFFSFRVIVKKNKHYRKRVYRGMEILMYLIHGSSFLSLYVTSRDEKLFILYISQLLVFIIFSALYKVSYRMMSQLVFQNMMMLLMIGFVMITRLSFEKGVRQFAISAAMLLICLVVPVAIEKFKSLGRLGWFYSLLGLAMLIVVLIFGQEYYGAKNWIIIGKFQFQPSEIVKLLYIFAVGALLSKAVKFKEIVLITIMAAIHVILLVLEKDLGAALIFFITYIIMLYAATKKAAYLAAGVGAGVVGAFAGYTLFDHVRIRVAAFLHPFELIEKEGYQISQSLFAIGTGGWLGMGLSQGLPNNIPVVDSDFIFAAIAEEFGGIFAICIILICISCFVMFINISVKIKNTFYKLVALGFSTMYIVQVLLNVGGVLKCIPSTGVTLPLVSYGGSSIVSSIFMFSIIQGLYVLHLRSDGNEVSLDEIEAEKQKDKKKKNSKKGNDQLQLQEERKLQKKLEKKRKDVTQSVIRFMYFFSALLFGVIGYYTYFLTFKSKTVVNNNYNYRQDLLAQRITRGKILSADGNILAQTVELDDGTEMRVYPYGNTFSHVVGRMQKGRTGVELSDNFNLLTSSINGFTKLTNEIAGKKNPGDNVVTTLNTKLQQVAYDALGNNQGAVVVLEPSTGKILAMVSKPDYNPNTVVNDWADLNNDSSSPLLNRATRGLYAPGSTFKILTTLDYMRENPDYESYEYECKGEGRFNDVTLHCVKSHGRVNLLSSFAHSCNTSFGNLGITLNMDSFQKLARDFLFNQPLPTAITTSQSSFVLDGTSDPNDYPQTVIGLGKTQITPLHNAMIVSAIANGGVLMKPYLIDHIESAYGDEVSRNTPSSYGSLISANEAQVLTTYMQEVVENGTGTKLKNMSVTVAGKTGTAKYDINKPEHAWFVGFAPVDNPEIAISVIVESVGSGSTYAVPIAKKIIEAYYSTK